MTKNMNISLDEWGEIFNRQSTKGKVHIANEYEKYRITNDQRDAINMAHYSLCIQLRKKKIKQRNTSTLA